MSWFADLQNSLNHNPRFVTIAVHAPFGAHLVYFGQKVTHTPVWVNALILMAYATWKEFYFDTRYESPPQTYTDAGWDYAGWTIGAVAGMALYWVWP